MAGRFHNKINPVSISAWDVLIAGLFLAGLYLTSLYSYLLFHSLAELFSITVAFTIFVLVWNSRRFLDNGYLEFVGVAFLFISGLDLVHTLAYRGMGILPGDDANPATQLWLSARYLQSLSLLAAPLFLTRKLDIRWALLGFSAVCAVLLLSVFWWQVFPDAFIEGSGLTPFKKYSEYLISLILVAALGLLLRNRSRFAPIVLRWLAFAILASIASELAFSDYANVYGGMNLIGHLLKILAFYLIYKALVQTGFVNPYDLLLYSHKESEDALRSVARFPEENPNPILRLNAGGAVLYANASGSDLLKKLDLLPGQEISLELHRAALAALDSASRQEVEFEILDRVLAFTIVPFLEKEYVNLYGRDITGIRRAERNAAFLAALSACLAQAAQPGEAVSRACQSLSEFLDVEQCAFAELAPERSALTVHPQGRGESLRFSREIPLERIPGEMLAELEAGRAVLVSDTAGDERTASLLETAFDRVQVGAFMAAPCIRHDRWVAVLAVAASRPRPWRQDELAVLRSAADRLWLAVENARLFLALRESRERLRLATRAAEIGTWLWDLSEDCLTWDSQCKALFGLPAEAEVTYPRFLEAVCPDDRDRIERATQEALDEQKEYDVEYRVVWPDGSLRWILSRGRAQYSADGRPQRMFGISMDITSRKHVEEHLRQDAARDQALASISRTMAEASLDDQAVYQDVVRQTADLLGGICLLRNVSSDGQWLNSVAIYHADPQAMKAMQETLESSRQRIDEGLSGRVLQTGQPLLIPLVSPETINTLFKREYRPWFEHHKITSAMAVPLRVSGSIIGVLIVFGDQPGRYYAAEDLVFLQEIADRIALAITNARLFQEAQRELVLRRHADDALKKYAGQLARSNRELQDFAFIASHDLQEPLRKILAFGERLSVKHGKSLDEEAQDYLARMQRAAARMKNMLEDLLSYSRVTTQAQPLVPVDLGKIAREVLSDLEVRLEETGGQVILEDLPTIEADPRQIQQLLQNLIGNALKFHQPGVRPVVRVSAKFHRALPNDSRSPEQIAQELEGTADAWGNGLRSEEHKYVSLCVEDNGIGFEEKYRERIFQPFQRLHGLNQYPGSGMGLAICRKIVERHHGSITAHSQPGQGTRFVVTLPLRQDEKN